MEHSLLCTLSLLSLLTWKSMHSAVSSCGRFSNVPFEIAESGQVEDSPLCRLKLLSQLRCKTHHSAA